MSSVSSTGSIPSAFDLIGVNLAGAEFAPQNDPGVYNIDYVYPTHQEIDYYNGKGLTVIRLPFLMDRLQAVANGPLDATQLAYMEDAVTYATAKGMAVVLDPHDYGYEHGTLINDSNSAAAFANFWGQLAQHFKANPLVMFGLENEPHMQTAAQWLPAVNAAIAAIRNAGATQEILVPAISWQSAAQFTTDGSSTVLAPGVVDPLNRYVFEVHQYLDSDASGTSTSIANGDLNIGPERLGAITQWASERGNKLFLGEIGVGTDAASLAALDNTLAYMQQHAEVWQGVTYFAGGPWWGTTAIAIEPNGLGSSSVTDRPQMTVLAKYADAQASATTTTTPATTTTGTTNPNTATGADTLILEVSEDAWQGDAQFTVSVDGVRVGGVQTATTLHSSGSTQAITLFGTFGTGSHEAAVSFINDAFGGSPTTDRNLYVQSVAINGSQSTSSPATMLSNGTSSFDLLAPVAITPTTLTLHLSEDAWMGDAQFVAAIDGQVLSEAQSVPMLHSTGQNQSFTFSGSLAAGTHDLATSFLNDAYGGTPTTDRNLYIDYVTVNNVTVPSSTVTMLSAGTTHLSFVVTF